MSDGIITPVEIEDTLYEGPLEFTTAAIEKAVRKQGGETESSTIKPPRPVVTLGQPEWWNLAQLARERGQSLPAELALLLRKADFYLLRLACSFRPERDSHVGWARFTAYLRAKTGQEQPTAFDVYPREIYDETKTDVKIKISPSLKFAAFEGTAVEGGLGEVITTIEFSKLEPVVIGFGVQESAPNWDFEKHETQPLRGCKFGYLIVKKPRSAEAVRLTLDVVADVITRNGLLSARIAEAARQHLSKLVCTD